MIIDNVKLDGQGIASETKTRLVVDHEIFFIGNGSSGYIIRILLPEVDDQSSNFQWTRAWLAGLQIVID